MPAVGKAVSPALLLVEDGSWTRAALAALLRKRGYAISTAANGREALELILDGLRPALILMDIDMDELDGLATLYALRQRSEVCEVPVIFYTSLDDPQTVERARQLGAVDYVVKASVTWNELFQRVERYAR